ncbi:unnamed protein product [Calypogeia fissa]
MADGETDGNVSKAQYKKLTSGNVFGTLRILVIGRPNAGKSTLVRLLLGLSDKEGPSKSSKHDITKEWSHPTLPLKIHECDMEVTPEDPNAPKQSLVKRVLKHARKHSDPEMKELEKFLNSRQNKSDFSERVHLVWFVLSALDDQNASMAKVFTEIGSYEQLPVLLIVTHNDQDPEGVEYSKNVEAHLGELLQNVSTKERILGNIVKVGNDVEHDRIDGGALTLVSVKTQALLDSDEMKAAWAAAQIVDFHEKIKLSAKAIVGYKEAAIGASPAGLIPGPHQVIVGSLLTGLCRALCKNWGVPKKFKKSLKKNLASQEVYNKQMNLLLAKFANMGKGAVGLGPFSGLAARAATPVATKVMTTTVMTSISETLSLSITPVAVAAAAVGWVYVSRNDAYNSMIAMVSLGMMVTGAILYVKAQYDPKGWDEDRSKKDYDKLIKEFVDLHGSDLKQNVGESHSVSDVFNPQKDRGQVIKQLEEYFDRVSAQHSGGDSQPVADSHES